MWPDSATEPASASPMPSRIERLPRRVTSAGTLAVQVLPEAAFGQGATPLQSPQNIASSPQEQCATLSVQELQAASRKARTPTSIESRLSVLPGGQIAKLHLPAPLGSGNSIAPR